MNLFHGAVAEHGLAVAHPDTKFKTTNPKERTMATKAKPKHKTNAQLIGDLMSFSKQGPLMQVFLIEAIRHYAEATTDAPDWGNEGFISQASWKACADEALKAINNRGK